MQTRESKLHKITHLYWMLYILLFQEISAFTNIHNGPYLKLQSHSKRYENSHVNFLMSAVVDESFSSKLRDKMREIIFMKETKNKRERIQAREKISTVVKRIDSLDEFKDFFMEESDKIIVVRFFASWCKVRNYNNVANEFFFEFTTQIRTYNI